MRWVLLIVMFLVPMTIQASLNSLQRTTPDETSFESVSTDFVADTHTSGAVYDDAVDQDVSIGFDFPFNGTDYSRVHINSNGTLSFTDNDDAAYSNGHIKDHDKSQIFPYWDDLNLGNANDGTQGKIKYDTLGSGNDKHLVVSWEGVPHYSNSGSYSLQVVLYTDGSIRFRYDSTSDANGDSNGGASIGVRESATHYDEYAYNSAIDQTKDVLYSPVPPPTDDDYSEYHFDELYWDGTSGEIKDSHWVNDGTGHNIPTVAGKICNGMDLTSDSATDYAEFEERALDGVTDFTIAVWHKGQNGDDSHALLSAANSSQDNEILFWMSNTTTFTGHLKNNQKSISTTNIDDGTWHHLAWRVKNKESCFFFDGAEKGCQTHSYAPSTLSVEGLILGQDQDNVGGGFSSSQDWEGVIDELMIFRKALTNSEIQKGYDNQNAGRNWDDDNNPRICPYPTITKTSCVIDDPVNSTTHPKRIPGATIRYAVEVHNPNTKDASNVIATDDIDTVHFDTNTIQNLKIDGSNACDCLDPTSLGANGGDGSGNGVNPVKLDYDSVAGGATECGYFEVKIK